MLLTLALVAAVCASWPIFFLLAIACCLDCPVSHLPCPCCLGCLTLPFSPLPPLMLTSLPPLLLLAMLLVGLREVLFAFSVCSSHHSSSNAWFGSAWMLVPHRIGLIVVVGVYLHVFLCLSHALLTMDKIH